MKNLCLLLCIIFLAGCMTVRTYEVEKPRFDLDVDGNRGYLAGGATDPVGENKFGETRKISVMEVEFKAKKGKKTYVIEKKKIKKVKDRDEEFIPEEESYFEPIEEDLDAARVVAIEPKTSGGDYNTYVIEKDDTLQKISKRYYGTTKKWKMLYDENSSILKSPNKLYPGTEIRIPILD